MDDKIKFFDETFKVLMALAGCVWFMYVLFLFVGGDARGCVAGSPSGFFGTLAWVAGILSAPPLVYGLIRLFLWPSVPGSKMSRVAAWGITAGVGIFVTAVIVFAVIISQYGCY